MALLKTYLRPHRGRIILLACSLLLATGFQLAMPQILRRFIDAATQGHALSALMQIAIVFWATAFASYAVNLGRTYLKERVAWSTTNQLRTDLAAHCLKLDLNFHQAHAPGELIERIDGDVSTLASLLSELLLVAIADLLLLVGVLAVMFLENRQIGLIFTAFALFALLLLYRMRNIATQEFEADRQSSADLFSFLEERLSGTEDIRANGAVAYTMNRLFDAMRNYRQANIGAYRKIIRLRTTIMLLFSFGGILALALGVIFYRSGVITLGVVYMLYTYMAMLAHPIEHLTLQIQSFQTGAASIKRIEVLRRTPITITDGHGRLPETLPDIRFENVTFGYDDASSVLHDLSFDLPAGQTLGLLGRTGSGKTTIARMLLRFHDPQRGAIRLGGVDIRDVPLSHLRERIALVTQDVHIFNASIRDNLAFFDATIPDSQLLAIIESLGLEHWFKRQPAGLDTLMESGHLSAGEAQLVALARVFLKNPQIVILDEASSRLDPKTEALIDDAVSRLLQDRTGIIIAHRLATIQRVDRVMVLQRGEIIEYGERQMLAKSEHSAFSRMLRFSRNEVLA